MPSSPLLRRLLALWLCLGACANIVFPVVVAAQPAGPVRVAPADVRQWRFEADGVSFDAGFPAARISTCTRLRAGVYRLVTRPENQPVNDSAWYAFRVSADTPREVAVELAVEGGRMRYQPRISVDGVNWLELPSEAWKPDGRSGGTLRLKIGPVPLWVAAQEIVDVARLNAWAGMLERLPFVRASEIGVSLGGRPLRAVEIAGNPAATRFVTIIGRQHPPETTGSLALMRFVETLCGDSRLARDFRSQFTVLVVPVVNPDGVEEGHWRHNLAGVDTNRDWGVFAQPETRAVRDAILALRERGRLFLHLDFHSTREDVFYTQPDDRPASPANFTGPWIRAIGERFPDYEVKRSSTRTPTLVTSHNWAHLTFKIPAITYEIGDRTDRALLAQITSGAAEEMMRLLLALKDAP